MNTKLISYLTLSLAMGIALMTEVNANIDSQSPTNHVTLVTFDGAEGTTFKFHVLNDPVMGGVSVGTFKVDENEKIGIFNGTVKIVPSLNAPGFLSMEALGNFNDASDTIAGGIVVRARASTPDYNGFRMVVAARTLSPSHACRYGGTIPFSSGCYKAHFKMPPGNEFTDIFIPFASFSDHWEPTTGEHITECSNDHTVCPTARALGLIEQISVMAEGVAGDIHIEVESISAAV